MNRLAALALVLAACADESPPDIQPPDTGPVHRFVVDEIDIVRARDGSAALAADLDGDRRDDHLLNSLIATLVALQGTTAAGNDQIRAGSIESTVEIIAADLENAEEAAVRFIGFDGASWVPVGGQFIAGRFASNRTQITDLPGRATLVLPVVRDADASILEAHLLEMDLEPSPRGGYDLIIRGGIESAELKRETGERLVQMIAANPRVHLDLSRLLDTNEDGVLDPAEITEGDVMRSLFQPDLRDQYISFWVRYHLTPCADGRCREPSAPTCFDRIPNGTETDVDCGGDCQPCGDTNVCVAASDCASGACDVGSCGSVTCSDGASNGLESGIDCGGPCEPCLTSGPCIDDWDCESGVCVESQCM